MPVRFGFIHEKIDIKILILFILRRLPEPITLEVLADLTLCDDGISYFDFAECVSELVTTEHLKLEDGKYSLTKKGIRNGDITQGSIPYTVRIKAEKSAAALRAEQTRNAMIKTSHAERREGGFKVALALSDGVGDIAAIELFAASEQQAHDLENGFRKNAEQIYSDLIKIILGEK